uniref:Mothers against decapentaplegic homolog n=1 Tax=Halisarca dujardinii TaxID=2583056 RepID=A0A8F8FL52_HALDU|nr:SMAD2 HduSMAD2 [Halisarca dujardinii]
MISTGLFSNVMSPSIKKLLNFRKPQEDDIDDWSDKAIKSLAKKLKKSGSLADLEAAITNPDRPSKCVTIPRSLDGRLQVSSKKGLPHVMYCKLWRWPDLQTHHELKGIDSCDFTFSKKGDDVCINPYHYIRVDNPVLPPVLVPRVPVPSELGGDYPSTLSPIQSDDYSSMSSQPPPYHPTLFGAGMQPFQFPETPPPIYDDKSDISASPRSNIGLPGSSASSVCSPVNSPMSSLPPPQAEVSEDVVPVTYIEPDHWCEISYYEMSDHVGEKFPARRQVINIDGGTDPSSDNRYCLGLLSNVNRDHQIEQTRRHIGKGIRLSYAAGEVYVENLSEGSIFVQSQNCNIRHRWHPATVCKVPQGCYLNLFNNQEFAEILSQMAHRGYEDVYQLVTMCTIRISFVKGWGAEYRRQNITNTPCWIQVILNGPLQWLDKVLVQMKPPPNGITSFS